MLDVNWTMIAISLTLIGIVLIWYVKRPKKASSGKVDIDEEELGMVYNRTIELINERKFYLNKSLKLSDLASE
ncbi:MAG: hypothetical protein ABJL43_10195, partial [Maribacter dokdonensis]|uniref:hypothetical protein n=1 Tax=Maribacter dokdonensis TaxID=320912 RepID=UPI00329A2489